MAQLILAVLLSVFIPVTALSQNNVIQNQPSFIVTGRVILLETHEIGIQAPNGVRILFEDVTNVGLFAFALMYAMEKSELWKFSFVWFYWKEIVWALKLALSGSTHILAACLCFKAKKDHPVASPTGWFFI